MNIESIFKIVVMIFTVTNLASMGLEINPKEATGSLKSPKFILLIILWGWIVGPAVAWLLTRILPLSESHAAGLILISLAPVAPFLPVMIRKAHGDMSSAGATILVATFGTVVFLPLMVPVLIKGLEVSTVALAKPLIILVLLLLLTGFAIRIFKGSLADKIFPVMKTTGNIFLLLTGVLTIWLYGNEMLSAVGSFALGAQILLFTIITVVSYKLGFGLKQGQRSSIALGMCTRNIAAVFIAYFDFTTPDPGVLVMIVLAIPLAFLVSFVAARIFSKYSSLTTVRGV